jgi:hypothetical protein
MPARYIDWTYYSRQNMRSIKRNKRSIRTSRTYIKAQSKRAKALKKLIKRQKIKTIRQRMQYYTASIKYLRQIYSLKYKTTYRMSSVRTRNFRNGTVIYGRAEVKYYGKWGTLCSSFRGYSYQRNYIATAFCKSMGLPHQQSWIIPNYGGGKGKIWFDDLKCSSTASTFMRCSKSTFNRCSHRKDLGIACHKANNTNSYWRIGNLYKGSSRGVKYFRGRIEYNYRGTWHPVCDDFANSKLAKVFCKSAGYPFSKAAIISKYGQKYGKSKNRIVLDNIKCKGTEANLRQCQTNRLFKHNCSTNE